MTAHLLEYFRDENPGVFRSHPLEVVRATTLAAVGNPYVDSHDRAGAERVVYYNDPRTGADQNEVRLVLRMVAHAGGAWNKAGAMATTAGETEGRILHSDGTMAAVEGAATTQVQGILFANYYDLLQNRLQAARVVTAQQNGDLYWVVVEGMIECYAGTDTIDVNEPIRTADDAEGGMLEATPTWVNAGDATNRHHTVNVQVGVALESVGHDGLANCLINIRATGYRAFA